MFVFFNTSSTPYPSKGPIIEIQDYDPSNQRQHFKMNPQGWLISARCPKAVDHQDMWVAVQKYENTKIQQCTNGALIFLDNNIHGNTYRWNIGIDGSFTVADIDCSQYKVGNLAITELEDNDIENMMEVVYVSFINPASGMAFSVAGSNCAIGGKVTL
jgi:hypothetical protein